jgi:hypothetical protein
MTHVILPWRENFPGRFFSVANPLLDYSLLDFMEKLPSEHRRGKRLFKETVRRMLPDLFRLNRAESSSFLLYWDQAFEAQKGELLRSVAESSSPLDAVIPKEALVSILQAYRGHPTPAHPHGTPRAVLKRLLRSTPLYDWAASVLRRPPPARVEVSSFLGRALVLRAFLTRTAAPVEDREARG